ncbi:UDP-glucosyltransferase 2-like [Periplaneta americana]|uniref:UDP-glucosyltransferase 2-like n=1 Tax=Periplaneta americana TaxID=6978 RepID=UPI0037E75DC1
MMKCILICLLIGTHFKQWCYGARILGLFPYNGRSHFIMYEALLKALATRGHQVDVLSHFPQKTRLENYTDLNVEESLRPVINNLPMQIVETFHPISVLQFLVKENVNVCEKVFKHPVVKDLLNSTQTYDLIITEIFGTDCFLGFVHKFKSPYISLISSVILPWANDRIGNPENTAYIPNYFLPYTEAMTFTQRTVNTVFSICVKWYYYFFSERPAQRIAGQYFGKDLPPLSDIANNMSFLLVNSHFSLQQPRPMVPAVVEVGGIHIQEPRSLPEDLQRFINESEHGVIYFSFGSMVQCETMPQEKLKALLGAFKELPQRILWKCKEDAFQELPSNVKLLKWIPQNDVLAHPKVVLFITHGGLLGTQEAIYSGVPMVGIPLFADQELNIEAYVKEGISVKLKYSSVNKESVLKAVKTVLDNPSYRENAHKMSQLFRDRPQTPLQTAIYWTEYVIRHRGAPHLRSSAMSLAWYQYLLLDVAAFLILTAAIFVALFYMLIRRFIKGFDINFNKYQLFNPSKLKLY